MASEFEESLTKSIATDDLKLSKDKLTEYELNPEKAIQVALFGDGDQPAAQFSVGKEVTVEQTRARRSYILSDKGKPYRARMSLEFLRKPVSELRTKQIFTEDRAKISELELMRRTPEGQAESIKIIQNADGEWALAEGEMKLEMSVINSVLGSMSSLMATGFVDDKTPAEVGLDPPMFTVRARIGTEDRAYALNVGKVGADYYVSPAKSSFIYTVSPNVGANVTAGMYELRERVPVTLDRKTFTRVEFAGGVVVEKSGESFVVVKPSKGATSDGKLNARFTTLAALRVARYTDLPVSVTGLNKPADRVVVQADGARHVLLLGNAVEGANEIYAQWQGGDQAFVLSKLIADRLKPTVADITDS